MKHSASRRKLRNLFHCLLSAAALGPAAFTCPSLPGEEINVMGLLGNTPPIWVSMSGFTGEAAQVLLFDLYVQGFGFTNADSALYLISGSNNGNLQGRLVSKAEKTTPVSKAYSGGSLRRQAHAFADDIVEYVTKHKGIGLTKVAFKGESGGAGEIFVADFDGYNAKPVTTDKALVAAPCWVPGRLALYYTSYKNNHVDIFYHDLATGDRRAFAAFGGSNMSPAASGDGRVAMILSKDGWPDLYVCNADRSGLIRLTRSPQDESSPCWSPDGKWICYASKDRERRALSRISASGGEPQRLNTRGISSPTEPDWSPDGKWIAFTSQHGANSFDICVMAADGSACSELVQGEDPSWAPNSRTLIFARRQGGHYVLSLLDVPTKQVKDVSRIAGINSQSQPSWAR